MSEDNIFAVKIGLISYFMTSDFKIFYADHIPLPLPEGHRFPADKYRKTRKLLESEFGISPENFEKSPLAPKELLSEVHDSGYVESVFSGGLSTIEQKRIGFPWSRDLVRRCQASTGGTYAAARQAVDQGYGAQLAGGTHHAHFDFGSGYCVFNDFAYTVHFLLKNKYCERVAIIDLDVHQGDGNAAMLSENESVFVASAHGQKNFPVRKKNSDIDIGLDDGCSDSEYLEKTEEIFHAVEHFRPDFLLYQAGVDCLETDALGRMKMSLEGLYERDRRVFAFAKSYQIPIVHVLGGGYSRPIEPTVLAYVNTFRAAFEIFDMNF